MRGFFCFQVQKHHYVAFVYNRGRQEWLLLDDDQAVPVRLDSKNRWTCLFRSGKNLRNTLILRMYFVWDQSQVHAGPPPPPARPLPRPDSIRYMGSREVAWLCLARVCCFLQGNVSSTRSHSNERLLLLLSGQPKIGPDFAGVLARCEEDKLHPSLFFFERQHNLA